MNSAIILPLRLCSKPCTWFSKLISIYFHTYHSTQQGVKSSWNSRTKSIQMTLFYPSESTVTHMFIIMETATRFTLVFSKKKKNVFFFFFQPKITGRGKRRRDCGEARTMPPRKNKPGARDGLTAILAETPLRLVLFHLRIHLLRFHSWKVFLLVVGWTDFFFSLAL